MKIVRFNSFNILAILFLFLSVSCKRELVAKIVSTTAPALQVTVKNATAQIITGAYVQLYNTESDWNAETGALLSKQTNSDGQVVFAKEELKDPGYFYLIASDGTTKVKTKTPYLLLTDGKTMLDMKLP
jgi:hypothetical protein